MSSTAVPPAYCEVGTLLVEPRRRSSSAAQGGVTGDDTSSSSVGLGGIIIIIIIIVIVVAEDPHVRPVRRGASIQTDLRGESLLKMSTPASPTGPPLQLTPDQLTVVVACCSSLVLFVIIVAMLSVIYHKDTQCCKCPSYQDSHGDMHAPPQYYSSRQTLDGQLFFVGLPSSYSLPSLDLPLPRLPSYESVRKKDRQRQIHMMIADRFGLNGAIITEPPPTYEESVRHSVDIPHDFLLPSLDDPEPADATAVRPVAHGETLSLQCDTNESINSPDFPV
ncbi:hypothetical protein N1851_032587 [Merluccius polli]|uniref:Uncharacterized protein n=1 Tax=Merluccius polli TaxID=89951 RepID=A0AA47M2K2_MERPO|nr:hypothetical protein N1851_032587 [Merluccius polli]